MSEHDTGAKRTNRFYIKSVLHGWHRPKFVKFAFEPRDLWIGLFWDSYPDPWTPWLTNFRVYICLLPTLVIVIDLIEREP